MPKLRRKIVAVGGGSRGVIIPAVFCEMLDLDVGTDIFIERVGKQIILEKAKEEEVIKKKKKRRTQGRWKKWREKRKVEK